MERALNLDLLALALGKHEDFPSANDLGRILADAELAILLHSPESTERMEEIGWYLHGIASSKFALKTYGVERQRAAFQVAGHIFDLKLHSPGLAKFDRLKYCFASQIAYVRSILDPNAVAIYRREFPNGLGETTLVPDFQQAGLSCAVAFLGYDIKYVFNTTTKLRQEINTLAQIWNVDNIESTIYGAVSNLVIGIRELTIFLTYGKSEHLHKSREYFLQAINNEASQEDEISRWVAAHLLNFSDKLESSSIWTVLPPDIPDDAKRAFINGNPPVLTLWPPQIDFLAEREGNNPLSEKTKRLILSTPTSGGKTLISQLLIVAHLSTKMTSVCYVAPTRSLCREVRKSLQSRLRFLGDQVIDGLPEGDWGDFILEDLQPEVEVMTPERLSYLIRSNSQRLLEKFGLFIFDEVHLVGDKARGWILEEDLSFLHNATQNSHHRIILISAAIGNRNHFIQWINGPTQDLSPLEFHCDWRGPRRIHAVWTTEARWTDANIETLPRGRKFPFRQRVPLFGRLDARISHTQEIVRLYTTEPIGILVRKGITNNVFKEIDASQSTPFYKMLGAIINFLAESGPVLVIESSKLATIQLAAHLANDLEVIHRPEITSLRNLIIARLGPEHPLIQIIEKGVAYHHGSLPSEIRTAIEDIVAAGLIKILVATTTLTEGVNLPVTSVVIASQGNYTEDGFNEFITGSKLINAIGRAGRATKETEGMVVLARQATPTDEDFNRLTPSETNLQVKSMLATAEALGELAIFEEMLKSSQDAIFEASGKVGDFLKFVWFVASEIEGSGKTVTVEHIAEVLHHTLGWIQLTEADQKRWLNATTVLIERYNQTASSVRRRWASSGTSIGSANKIEVIVQSIIADLVKNDFPLDMLDAFQFLIANGRLENLLALPESPRRKVFDHRSGSRTEIPISVGELLFDWINGISLIEISNKYLLEVQDISFRFEQLGDLIYDFFEVFLPWIMGTIISWTNCLLNEKGNYGMFPTTIPASIRYGVGSVVALDLMIKGIQSRGLATKISLIWTRENISQDVISWIRELTLHQWKELFNPSPTEVRNLLEIVRPQRGGIVVDLFKNEETTCVVESRVDEQPPTPAILNYIGNPDYPSIGICIEDQLVGEVYIKDQADMDYLQQSGFLGVIEFSSSSGVGNLHLAIPSPE
ncbi:MAG TPA: DEAD/DEAH box helicase [Bellilinea sp.]|nr:DEAD/DEAH box helicase [Bellilinea sp.]